MTDKETYLDYLRATNSWNIGRIPKLEEGRNYRVMKDMEKFVFLFPKVFVYLDRYEGTVIIHIHPQTTTRIFIRDKANDTEEYLSFVRARFRVYDKISILGKTSEEIATLVRTKLNDCLFKYNGMVLTTDKILIKPTHVTSEMLHKAF